ncbi:MAG: hypothetical protein LBI27_09270 [Clostridiales bacterium]|jgi:hypothetical protein|nr:hypothetical protein [Clostridiales bacterium]
MNIIRTKVVELSEIPALAYKMKLKSGGSGVKLYRTDVDATFFAETDKRTGEAVTSEKSELFPESALCEALELLEGLPYSARGKVKIVISNEAEAEEICPGTEKLSMVESDEFNSIVDRFSDENGKLNYALMNKQFIQFASSSKVVSTMAGERASEKDISMFVLKNRAAFLANKKEHLSDEEATALLEALNEINPRSALKELNLHIRKMLSR